MEVSIRPAQASDKPAIVGKGGISENDPRDYLPHVFDKWLEDAQLQKQMFVAVANGTVVALHTVGLYDDGETAMFQALRVAPAARGCGISKRLTKHAQRYAGSLEPAPRRLRVTAPSTNSASIVLHQRQGFSLTTLQMALLSINLAGVRPAELPTDAWAEVLDRVAVRQVCAGELAARPLHKLVPFDGTGHTIVHNWAAHDLRPSSFTELERQGATLALLEDADGSVRGFSCSELTQRPAGLFLMCTVHSGSDDEATLFLATHALMAACSDEKSIPACFVLLHAPVTTNTARRLSAGHGREATAHLEGGATLVLLEKNMKG